MYRFPRQAWANIHGILVLRWCKKPVQKPNRRVVSLFVWMYVCRFDQFLRENEHTYIHTLHTYIHPHKQTYNSSSRFSHHLEKRIPCMFANAGHRIIQPTWKIDRFFENPEFQIPRPGPRFYTKTSKKRKKQVFRCRVCMYVWQFCPCRPRKSAHPYIPTWTHAVSKIADLKCMFTFHRPASRKRALTPPGL